MVPDSDTMQVKNLADLSKFAAVQMTFWEHFFSFVNSAAIHKKRVRAIIDYDTNSGTFNVIFSKFD